MVNILSFLLLFLLPTQLGRHFFLPFSYLSGVRIDYLAPTLYLTDIIVFALFLLNIKAIFRFFKNKTFLIFLALIIVNILFSLVKEIAIYKSVKLLEILILFAVYYKSKISPKLILYAFSLGALMELILSIMQFTMKHSVQGIFYFLGERYLTLSIPDIAKSSFFGAEILRPYGTFSHPNSMAGFFLLVYFFVLLYEKFSPHTYLKYFILTISSVLIFFSFSKTAIVVYILLNFIYLIKKKFYRKCMFCFVARIFVFMILGLIFMSTQGDILSADKRLTLLQSSITVFFQHSFFGVGLGNYVVAQNDFVNKYSYFFLQPVHNIFMLLLSETGIILGGFIFYKLYEFAKLKIRNEVFIYCLLAVALTGLFDHYWLTLQQNLLLLPIIFAFF